MAIRYISPAFLSTLSLRRATKISCAATLSCRIFLSTLSLRRATAPSRHLCPRSKISIHALLAESDGLAGGHEILRGNFYPRSPCGERPPPSPPKTRVLNFYPRSPCGERLHNLNLPSRPIDISIHALLAESDS